MLYSREEALNVLGSLCNNLDLLRDRKYDLRVNDFDDLFHKTLFGVLTNLSLEKDTKEVDGFMIDSYLRSFPVQHKTFELNNGVEVVSMMKEKASASFDYSYKMVKKMSLLRKLKLVGMDVSEIVDEDTFDMMKMQEQKIKLDKMTIDEIKCHFKTKLIEIDQEFQTKTDSYSFKAGDGIEELILKCKEAEHWGLPFQSKLFNAVFRGMIGAKVMIRSGGSGTGKSRQSIGDMCNISCAERYVPSLKKWVINNKTENSCFISTELTEDEVHLIMLATVAGVPEETIKDGRYSPEIEQRLIKAAQIIKNSKIHCEYNSNFSIADIENMIEKNIIRNQTKIIFFDYIQITAKLSQELNRMFGYTLREDQMLNQLSTALKNLANKYNVFILTATQLNRSYKTDNYLDATHLRGGQSTSDKVDYGVITMKVTKADLDKLQPILEDGFRTRPTHGHHIFKNRGGKWTGVILWVNMDLDTMNVKDCFATTQDFELLNEIIPINIG